MPGKKCQPAAVRTVCFIREGEGARVCRSAV